MGSRSTFAEGGGGYIGVTEVPRGTYGGHYVYQESIPQSAEVQAHEDTARLAAELALAIELPDVKE